MLRDVERETVGLTDGNFRDHVHAVTSEHLIIAAAIPRMSDDLPNPCLRPQIGECSRA
jgi:hypothetical protein